MTSPHALQPAKLDALRISKLDANGLPEPMQPLGALSGSFTITADPDDWPDPAGYEYRPTRRLDMSESYVARLAKKDR